MSINKITLPKNTNPDEVYVYTVVKKTHTFIVKPGFYVEHLHC